MQRQRVRIVTLNTWKGERDYANRLRCLADGLARIEPDVVLLQEVLVASAGEIDTGVFLARALDMYLCFAPARRKRRRVGERSVDCYSGLAILSRLPLSATRILALNSNPRDGERVALWAECHLGSVVVGLLNVHLTHLDPGDRLRAQQVGQLVDFLDTRVTDLCVLGGDFNAGVHSPELHRLAGRDDAISVWDECNAGNDLNTLNFDGRGCIDHLFRFGGGVLGIRWAALSVALDRPTCDGSFASDHAAVVADLDLPDGVDVCA